MESKRLRLTPGMARVEFLAVKDEVESLLARGYLLKPAYAQLTKEKRISMTYDTFRRYARKYFPGGKNEDVWEPWPRKKSPLKSGTCPPMSANSSG